MIFQQMNCEVTWLQYQGQE